MMREEMREEEDVWVLYYYLQPGWHGLRYHTLGVRDSAPVLQPPVGQLGPARVGSPGDLIQEVSLLGWRYKVRDVEDTVRSSTNFVIL